MVQNLNFVEGAIPPQIEEMSFPPSDIEELSTKKQTCMPFLQSFL